MRKNEKQILELTCSYCNKPFSVELKRVKYKKKKREQINFYCSKQCSWKSQENGLIEKKCIYCGKTFLTTGGYFSKKCCSKKCSAKYSQQFVDPNSIREAWKRGCYDGISEIVALKIRKYKNCSVCGKRYYGNRKYCSLKCFQQSDWKEKISDTRKKLFQENKLNVTGGTAKWINYGEIKIQGSYEYRACKVLDAWTKNKKIANWEYTKDRIQYIGIDGKTHNYLLDFKIWNNDGSFYYLETKGYEKENDKLKWEAVRNKGLKLIVWFDKDLKEEESQFDVNAPVV